MQMQMRWCHVALEAALHELETSTVRKRRSRDGSTCTRENVRVLQNFYGILVLRSRCGNDGVKT